MIALILILLTFQFHTSPEMECELTDEATRILQLERPDELIVKTDQLIEDWNLFLSVKCPTIAKGDFNGDGTIDFAILITANTSNLYPYELVVLQSSKASFEVISLDEIGFGIYVGGIGWGIDSFTERVLSDSLTLQFDGIYFEKFESSSLVYYWTLNGYEKFWLSD